MLKNFGLWSQKGFFFKKKGIQKDGAKDKGQNRKEVIKDF